MVVDYSKYIKHISECNKEAIDYLSKRASGEIRSIETEWTKINEALAGGFEWGTISVVGGRPSSGKTLFVNRISRNCLDLNPLTPYIALEFQYEMLGRNSSIRMLSAEYGLTMAELKSAKTPLSKTILESAENFFKHYNTKNIFIVDDPMNIDQMEKIILLMYEKYKLPLMVTIDHSILVNKSASDRDQIEMLQSLGKKLTKLKKTIPVAFIVVSQLNRDIDTKDRLMPFSASNYPNSSDLFGGDALFQHADNVIILDRPHKRNLTQYGPHRWIIDDPKYIAIHVIKGRDTGESFMWFEADFKNMNLKELDKHYYPKQATK